MLAGAIFTRIASAKPASSVPLAKVELRPRRIGYIEGPNGNLPFSGSIPRHVIDHFTVPWVCTPHPRDDKPHEVAVMELEHPIQRHSRAMQELINPTIAELGDAEQAFRELWPEHKSEDWRSDWHSFPLAELETR